METQKPTEKELLDGLLDQLLKDYKKPEDILGEQGLLKRFSKGVLERALGGELTDHLGYEKHAAAGYGSGNARNGTSEKTLKRKNGEVTI
jgi:putative transposase